jgi:uncharacterized protein with GYD domain
MERNERNMERNEMRNEESMKNRRNMQKYLVLIKLNPTKTSEFLDSVSELSNMPAEGVRLDATYNVFGNWDFAVWFEADTNENAVHFVGEQIRSIEGVIETITMPATAVKEYPMNM